MNIIKDGNTVYKGTKKIKKGTGAAEGEFQKIGDKYVYAGGNTGRTEEQIRNDERNKALDEYKALLAMNTGYNKAMSVVSRGTSTAQKSINSIGGSGTVQRKPTAGEAFAASVKPKQTGGASLTSYLDRQHAGSIDANEAMRQKSMDDTWELVEQYRKEHEKVSRETDAATRNGSAIIASKRSGEKDEAAKKLLGAQAQLDALREQGELAKGADYWRGQAQGAQRTLDEMQKNAPTMRYTRDGYLDTAYQEYKDREREVRSSYDKARERLYYAENEENWSRMPQNVQALAMEAGALNQQSGVMSWDINDGVERRKLFGAARDIRSAEDARRVYEIEQQLDGMGYSGADVVEYATRLYNRQMSSKAMKEAAEFATKNGWAAAGATVGTYLTNLMSSVGSVDVIGQMAGSGSDIGNYRPVDTNTANMSFTNYTGTVRGAVGEKLAPFWKFVYDATNSTFDSAIRMLAGNMIGTGIASGMEFASQAAAEEYVGKLVSGFITTQMSGEVLANAFVQSKQSGKSDADAMIDAMASALIESLTEKYSVEAILKNPAQLTFVELKNSFLAEGSEEMASDILEQIYQKFRYGKSGIAQEAEKYAAAGISQEEAQMLAIRDFVGETLRDGLAGGFSGLAMAGVSAGAKNYREARQIWQLSDAVTGDTEATAELIASGMEAAEGTRARTLAEQAQQKLANGEELTKKEIRSIARANEKAMRDEIRQENADEPETVQDQLEEEQSASEPDTAEPEDESINFDYQMDYDDFDYIEDEFNKPAAKETESPAQEERNPAKDIPMFNVLSPEAQKNAMRDYYGEQEEENTGGSAEPEGELSPEERGIGMTLERRTASADGANVTGIRYEGGKISVIEKGADGSVETVARENAKLSKEADTLVSISAKYDEAAPTVFAVYEDGTDLGKYARDVEYLAAAAKASAAGDGLKMRAYATGSDHLEVLSAERAQLIFDRLHEVYGTSLRQLKGSSVKGAGNVTWKADTKFDTLNDRRKAEVTAAAAMLTGMGLNVEIFESRADANGRFVGENGWFDAKTATVGIDINAGANRVSELAYTALIRTASHETVHFMRVNAPQEFSELQSFLFDHLTEWDGKSLDDLITAKQMRAKGELSYDAALEEVTADGCEMCLSRSSYAKQLAAQKPNLWQRFVSSIQKLLDRIDLAIRGVKASDRAARYMEQYRDELQARFDRTLKAAVENSISADIPAADTLMTPAQETAFSLRDDEKFMDKATERNDVLDFVDDTVMQKAAEDRRRIAKIMRAPKLKDALNLPEDYSGNTFFADGAYDGTEENTTVCPRSMGAEQLLDAVSELLGRPLTVDECITISQFIAGNTLNPECEYCYVATDRKAYREFLGEYVKQRDEVIGKYRDGADRESLYREFLNGRKDTKPMKARFDTWIRLSDSGARMMSAADLANVNKLMHDIIDDDIRDQVKDAMKYAQSASWAKKRIGYTAYNGHILKWSQQKINKLNKHYGLRMYSFSDFSPAYILENMQMITDAAVRGLKMLAYTKDLNFVKIFAKSGVNINISTFGFTRNGVVAENALQGASWEEAKKLRAMYPNVGITFVATNDQLVEWALAQDWIDVVIPYHLVRTGKAVAKRLGFTNYTAESSDIKLDDWEKKYEKSISPVVHNNSKEQYLKALEENHLRPRFERFIDNPNYMKLVNETRMSASEMSAVQPVFDVDAAEKALLQMIGDGGYFTPIGGSVDRMQKIALDLSDKLYKEERGEAGSGRMYSERTFDDPSSGEEVKYSFREGDPPKKTGVAYKVFMAKDGKLYPPMVGNPGGEGTPVGIWLNADAAPLGAPSKTGRLQVQAGGKGTSTGKTSLAYRPGWHLGDIPLAKQFARMNPATGEKDLFPANFVWAECEYAMDVDYQDEAMSYGYTDNGKFRHSYAGLPRIPSDGYYRYRTNPNPDTVPWVITGAMKVTRILTDGEVAEICRANGVEPMQRVGGDIDLEKYGLTAGSTERKYSERENETDRDSDGNQLSEGQQEFFKDSKVRDEDGKLMVMYHGTNQGDFYVFQWDKTQRADGGFYGRGHYFTSSKGMAENYGGRILNGYLNVTNPFIWSEEVNSYKGRPVSEIAPRNIAARINMARIFPKLFADRRMEYAEYNSGTGEYEVKHIKWSDIEREITSAEKTLSLTPFADGSFAWFGPGKYWDEQYGNRYDSKEDAEAHKFEASVYAFIGKYDGIGDSLTFDDQTTYTKENGSEITEALKALGYDGAMQDRHGTEAVAFNSNQFKLADNLNPTENEDIRYSFRSWIDDEIARLEQEVEELEERNTKDLREAGLDKLSEENLERKNAASALLVLKREQLEKLERQRERDLKRYRERRDERDAVNKYRKSVEKKANDLTDILTTNSDKKHVPEALKQPLGEFLRGINVLSRALNEREEITKADATRLRRLNRLQDALSGVAITDTSDDGGKNLGMDGTLDLPPEFMKVFKTVCDGIEDLVDENKGEYYVRSMSSSQLKELDKILTILRTAVNETNRMFAGAQMKHISEAAQSTIDRLDQFGESKARSELADKLDRFFKWDNTTPYYAFRRFGAGGEAVFESLMDGWDRLAMNSRKVIEDSKKMFDAKEAEEFGTKTVTVPLDSGETVTMTVSQLMSFYCLSKRKHARGHIFGGGIRVGEVQRGATKLKDSAHHVLTVEDVNRLNGMLKERPREIADKLQQYMETVGSAWGNEISMKRWGYKAFGEKNYFPIVTDKSDQKTVDEEARENDLFRLLNLSATKSLTPNANNALMLQDIFEVFSSHMADMGKYNALALPTLDVIRWTNYKETEKDGDGHVSTRTMHRAIESAYGKDAMRYIVTFVKDLNGVKNTGRGDYIGKKLVSNYKAAAVGANLRVALLQPTAYIRASFIIDPKWLRKGVNVSYRALKAEMLKYSGIASWKDLGFFDTNIGRDIQDQIRQNDSFRDKIVEKSMTLAELGDSVTWAALWNACKKEQRSKTKLQGEELMRATAKRFREVIYATQVVDSTMTRSHMMRGGDSMTGMLTSFMSEPTLSYNMVMSTVTDYANEARATNRSEAWKKHGGRIMRAFAVYASSSLVSAIAESLMDAARDDDDYESFLDKFWQAFWGWDGNLVSDLDPFEKLPLLRDVISILRGFSVERMDMSVFVDTYKAITALVEKFGLWLGFIDEPTDATYNGKMTAYGSVYASMKVISEASGIPVAGASRDIVALWNTIVGYSHPSWKLKTYDPGTLASIKYAFRDGFLTEDEAMRALMEDEGLDENAAYFKLQSFAAPGSSFSRYDKLKLALLNDGDVESAITELTEHGVEEKTVRSTITASVKAWYTGTSEDGNTMGYSEAMDALRSYAGLDYDAARNKLELWDFREETGDEDVTEAQMRGYREIAEPADISLDVYSDFYDFQNETHSDYDDAGKETVSKKEKVIGYIDGLKISPEQKDALYLTLYSEKNLGDTPWHKGKKTGKKK